MTPPAHRRRVPLADMVIRLAAAGLVVLAHTLVACQRSAPIVPADWSRTPLLFVHGHGLDASCWTSVIQALIADGYPREFLHAVDIVPHTMPNVRAAETVLAPAVERLIERAGYAAREAGVHPPTQVTLVCHSMGAVSGRWYAARLRPERVRTWISIAGANHGTDAVARFRDEAAQELSPAFGTLPSNQVLLDLNGPTSATVDETPYGLGKDRPGAASIPADPMRGILYLTVRIEPDAWIQPERSAVLDGAGGLPCLLPIGIDSTEGPPGNYLLRGVTDHDAMLQHPQLIRLVRALLAARP